MFRQVKPNKIFVLVIAIWTVLVVLSCFWNIYVEKKQINRLIHAKAEDNFNKDLAFRHWATRHGGIYVKTDSRTPPNPNLKHIKERDITTPSGIKLTLMNPAYMLRQLMSEFPSQYGVQGRITSLRPINIINKPDPWEIKALKQFENGISEVSEFVSVNNKKYLRFMKPMLVNKGCLKCHGYQNYHVGDIRGGVGVLVTVETFRKVESSYTRNMAMTHSLIWIVGLFGLSFSFIKIRTSVEKINKTQTELQETNNLLVAMAENYPNSYISIITKEMNVCFTSGQEYKKHNMDPHIHLGKSVDDMYGKLAPMIKKKYTEAFKGKDVSFEIYFNGQDQLFKAVPLKNKDNKVDQLLVVAENITEQKKAGIEIKNSLKQKEVLLAEIHHRVKNNLQIVSSIINLESQMIKDKNVSSYLTNTAFRVQAMGILHKKLYHSDDFSRIDMYDYLSAIVGQLQTIQTYSERPVSFQFDINEVYMNLETAMPCGLITNEIVTNSMKYAFEEDTDCEIGICLQKEGAEYEFILYDNGVGIPEGVDFKNNNRLGLQLISALAKQLNGSVELMRESGTKYIFHFKDNLKEEKRWRKSEY